VPAPSPLAAVPPFDAKPFETSCTITSPSGAVHTDDCVVLKKTDYNALIDTVRAMCHALGGTNDRCQWP
jgi:hypothetical protein